MIQKIVSLVAIAFTAMLATAGLSHCEALSSQIKDRKLKSAVQEYMQCHKQQDYKCVWRLLSRRLKEGNDNDQIGAEKYFRDQGFHPSDFLLEKIEEAESTALVTVKVTYIENTTGQRLGSSIEEWSFVKEKDAWFFDTYKTLSESP
jgi:hypothetical protein